MNAKLERDLAKVDTNAEIQRRRLFTATGRVGDTMERAPVLICSTPRVCYDKPDRVEFLTGRLCRNTSGAPVIAYLCPRYPLAGIIPGVVVGGFPMLAPDCMRRDKARRWKVSP